MRFTTSERKLSAQLAILYMNGVIIEEDVSEVLSNYFPTTKVVELGDEHFVACCAVLAKRQ